MSNPNYHTHYQLLCARPPYSQASVCAEHFCKEPHPEGSLHLLLAQGP
jgi:hypothetical protein